MAGEWVETTIGAQATLQRGVDITRANQRDGPIPVISSGGISSFHDVAAATGPGVVLGRKGVVGSVWFVTGDYWPHDTTLWVKDFHGNDRRFVYYFFKWMAPRLAAMDVGSANPTLNRNHVHPIEVRWPPLAEQRAIAHILGTLDDKIELNRRMNETLAAIARAIFKSWFVDFDPVRAKASAEPSESICRRLGLTPDLLALFPDRLVDSELGEIPEGWEWKSIGEEVSVRGGATPSTSNEEYWVNGEFAWVTPKDLAGAATTVLTRSERRITAAAVQKIASGQLPRGTVLLSSRAPIGYVALAMIPLSINQGFIAMVCDKRLPNTYVLHWTLENIAAIKQRAGGTTFAEISKGNFRPMSILVPDNRVLQSFDQFATPLYEKVTASVKESDSLGETRDSLLPKLLSGELRVPLEGIA